METILCIQPSVRAFPGLQSQPQYTTYNRLQTDVVHSPWILSLHVAYSCHFNCFILSFSLFSSSIFTHFFPMPFLSVCPDSPLPFSPLLKCLWNLLHHWWKPTAVSKIATVLASVLKGEITANEWSDDHRLRRGTWRDGQIAQSSSETTCHRKDHSSTPPTCTRGRNMLSFSFKCRRQMKRQD